MKTCEENFRAHLRKEKRSKYCPNDPAHLYLKTFIFNIRLRDVKPSSILGLSKKRPGYVSSAKTVFIVISCLYVFSSSFHGIHKKISPFWILNYSTLKVIKSVFAASAFAIFNSYCWKFETAELKNPLVFAKVYVFTKHKRPEEIKFFI